MAPAYQNQTVTNYGTRTNTPLALPSGLVNDDILAVQFLVGISGPPGSIPAVTPPAGFAAFGTQTEVADPSSFRLQMWLYWKRAASEASSYTFLHTAANTEAAMLVYRGAKKTGVPFGANTSNNTGSMEVSTGLDITTTQANSLLLYWAHNWSSSLGNDPSGMTQRFNHLGYAADEVRATAGATGNRVQSANGNPAGNAANMWAARMFELLGEGGGMKAWNGSSWPEKPTKVWNGSSWVTKPVKFWNGSSWVLS